ncbi:MAG: hypothetical protein KF812_01590 [Fimbriimonadaceae bacterium]|nr:hypothetical protein [Fimbriimonadaceae bacterium]
MNLRRHLAGGFDYDLWATEAWEQVLPELPDPDRANQILRHIQDVPEMWRARWEGSQGKHESSPMGDYRRILGYWKDVSQSEDLDAKFEWVRKRDGITRTTTLKELLAHLVLHGTYHRGQMRGLCDADDFEEFKDTDYSIWVREQTGEVASPEDQFLNARCHHDLWGWMALANAWRIRDDLSSRFIGRAEQILEHSCGCPGRWGEVAAAQWGLEPPPTGTTLEALQATYDWWAKTLASAGPDRVMERGNWEGEIFERTCEGVMTHISNHGHYHRGHIRGLAEREGWEDFPDTDFIFFADPARIPG